MKLAVLKETVPGERRVAIMPASVGALGALGLEVLVESGAGEAAGWSDARYQEAGARVVAGREEAMSAELLVQVRCGGLSAGGEDDASGYRAGQVVVGLCDPLSHPDAAARLAARGVTLFALELLPRITRAQSMDVLSSMATIAGYRAVLLAAVELPKMFPLMMTAAGTLTAARVFVLGAGVAGLQAIATAKRLGSVVQAYDVRPAVREQVESLGARFVELPLEAEGAEDRGGYARAMGADFYQRQQELLGALVSQSDVVVTTAVVPGQSAPRLISASAVRGMEPGSVVVDLAAERGGNCELTRADERVVEGGVVILGPTNLPSEVPRHASQMYSNNLTSFLRTLVRDGQFQLDSDDEILRETRVTHGGEVVHPRVAERLAAAPPAAGEAGPGDEPPGASQPPPSDPERPS